MPSYIYESEGGLDASAKVYEYYNDDFVGGINVSGHSDNLANDNDVESGGLYFGGDSFDYT
jgi:hypothetical protein